jgi:hypothetical protein
VCKSPDHFAAKCPNRKGGKKSINMVISEARGTSGYSNILPTVILVCQSSEWWVDTGLIFIYVLMFPYFPLIRSVGLPPC